MENKTILTWNDFDLYADMIAQYFQGDIKTIVGITRGGLPLAVTLSNRMGIPMKTLHWQTRDGFTRSQTQLEEIKLNYNMETTLFVDDICDSDKTIQEIKEIAPKSRWATLMTKQPDLVEYSPEYTESEAWIIFPWEQLLRIKRLEYLYPILINQINTNKE